MFTVALNVVMVSVVVLNVVIVSTIMLNVVTPFQAAGKKAFNPQTLQLILPELRRKKFYSIRPR